MKSYKILKLIIVIVLIVLAILLGRTFFKKDNINLEPANSNINQENLVDMSFVTEIPLATASPYATVEGSYPQFRNADASFNDKIRNNIVIAQAEFENNAKENWQARIDTMPAGEVEKYPTKGDMYFSVRSNYVQVNEDTVSFWVSIAGYSGGAHGYEALYSYNYDVKNGRQINLSDLFPNDTNYLKTVAEYSRADLIKQFTKKIESEGGEEYGDFKMVMENLNSMIVSGTEPRQENFSVFTVEPGFVTFYFSEYQVAPYVYGKQMVRMPL